MFEFVHRLVPATEMTSMAGMEEDTMAVAILIIATDMKEMAILLLAILVMEMMVVTCNCRSRVRLLRVNDSCVQLLF